MSFITIHFQHPLVSHFGCFHIYFKALLHSFYFIQAKQNEVDGKEKNHFTDWCAEKKMLFKSEKF